MTTAITVQERASVALKSPAAEKALRALVAGTIDIGAPTNRAGREQCHAAAMAALKARTEIVSAGKAARADATAFSKAVIAEEARLVAIIEPEEKRLKDLRDSWDAEQERIKNAKERAEKARVDAILLRIDEIRDAPVLASARGIDGCRTLIAWLDLPERKEGFDEFATKAELAIEAARSAVVEILAAKEAEAAAAEEAKKEAARIAAEQAEARAKLVAEQAEFERQKAAQEAAAAIERKAEAERVAAERAKIEEERAAFEAERAAEVAKIEAERKRAADEAAAERAIIEAKEKAIRDADDEARRKEEAAEAARRAAMSEVRRQIESALDLMDHDGLLRVLAFVEQA